MDLGIRGRKAIINGGSAGMGKGSAKALAREGVEIFLVARGEERLRAAAEEIAAETGAPVTPVVADHSTVEGRATILAACPEPDILVMTCAPPATTGDYRDISPEDWHEAIDITLLSPIEMMRATIDGMAARGFGRIVNIATGAAKYPAEIRLLSGAPRAALVNYTVAVSKRVARHNVIINNLLPGMFHTATIHDRMTELAQQNGTSYDEEVQKFVREWRIPAGKFGDPDDLGAFCALFCSKYASFTVGQSLVIDGGLINSTF
ncbi:SDR family oxidoreductase [Iodidimonas sp. SYSU 1G8]|uniref:SDR family oxidoreductase n=1 Tax=Iodidimonas sp. SYSU 1G8 TaxID=3133967 RepID=UPI0031FE7B2C